MPDDIPPWMAGLIHRIDTASRIAGRIICWMLVPLMAAMVYEVVARKLFVPPTMWAYDVSRMLCGTMFMLGAGYALSKGVHIRADFLYRNWPARRQGMVDAALYVLFYFPALIFFAWVSYDYAAATGIVGASVTILGIMAAKTMNRSGYDVRLAAGTITAGGTLGILIPPSIMLVVLGPVLEVPVTDLFAAAIMPGLLLAFLYTAYSLVRCWLNPELGPPLPKEEHPESFAIVVREFTQGLVPPAALVGFALGSILFGWATPTEGAACGAFGSLVLTAAYGKLNSKRFTDALIKTLEISVLILFLVAASNFFGAVFSRLGTPGMLTNMLLDQRGRRGVRGVREWFSYWRLPPNAPLMPSRSNTPPTSSCSGP